MKHFVHSLDEQSTENKTKIVHSSTTDTKWILHFYKKTAINAGEIMQKHLPRFLKILSERQVFNQDAKETANHSPGVEVKPHQVLMKSVHNSWVFRRVL